MKQLKAILPFLIIAILATVLFLNRPIEKSKPAAHYLTEGGLDKGIKLKRAELKRDKDNSHLRFELGLMLVYSAFQDMYQQMHAWGFRGSVNEFLGEWTKENRPEEPHPVTYAEFKKLFDDFYKKLDEAQEILSKARDLKEPLILPLGKIKLDLNSNGKLEKSESLEVIFGSIMGEEIGDKLESTTIHFDQGDVTWLEGYCHLTMFLQDLIFNFDASWAYQFVGKWIFDEISYKGIDLQADPMILKQEPGDRLKKAHAHLRKSIELSHISWSYYRAETDDDHEWVPNPNQTSLFESIPVTEETVEAWLSMLKEMDMVLTGEKLIPTFSFYGRNMGFNLKRFFYETGDINLHTYEASLPYAEKGELTKVDFWERVWEMFPGANGMFALWVN